MSNSSIQPKDKTLSEATTPDQNEPGSDGSKEVLRIAQSSNITGALQLDCLVSYPGHSLVVWVLPFLPRSVFYSSSHLGWIDVEIRLFIIIITVCFYFLKIVRSVYCYPLLIQHQHLKEVLVV